MTVATDRARVDADSELLERAELLEALDGFLADAAEGRGRLVFVRGEAGVGKTVLLRRFCDRHATTVRVLWGACVHLDTPRPLGPIADVAERAGGELEELVERGVRVHEVGAAFLRELRAKPSIVVLEDVHWADDATLDLLRIVARRLDDVPAIVVATLRDDELDAAHPLQLVLGESTSVAGIGRLQLTPLSLDSVRRLAEPYGADERELYRRTGGNPFFVTEVLAAGNASIPETVRDAVIARAARLPTRARALLEAVAVVPNGVELPLLEAVAAGDLAHLDECVAAGMLRFRDGVVAFRHDLARQAIEESTPPHRRLLLHRAALDGMRGLPGAKDVARLAHHADAAGDVEAVLEYAPVAGARAAAVGAHREAAAQFGRAVRFADALPAEERVELLERRAYECYLVDQLEEALDAARGALTCRRHLGEPAGEGNALRELSRLLRFVGREEEADEAGRESIALLESLPPSTALARAYGNMAWLRLIVNDNTGAIAWGEKAKELGERLDDVGVVADALNTIGSAEFSAGVGDWRRSSERALELARASGNDEQVARALGKIAYIAVHERDLDAADGYLAEGLEHTSTRDLARWRGNLLMLRAELELARGRLEAAAKAAADSLATRVFGHITVGALVVLARVRARRGDPGAWPLLDEALAIVDPADDLDQLGPVAAARAEAHLLEGRPEAVGGETEVAFAAACARDDPWWIGELAWLRRLSGGEDGEVTRAADPYALLLAGEWERAVEYWTELGCPYEAALARAEGDEPSLRAALAELQRLGAYPAAQLVAARLRERGVRAAARAPRAATRANPAQLTSREVEVLQLVATGLRNAEIASRLVVSPKTVEHHVSAILRKLRVRSRHEAVREAQRLGLG